MFEADQYNTFAAVDHDRKVVVYQTSVWAGGSDDRYGEVWFVYVARSADWAFQFDIRASETGERQRFARLGVGRGALPDETTCRLVVKDFILFETARLHTEWKIPEAATNIEIDIESYIKDGTLGEEYSRFPLHIYGF